MRSDTTPLPVYVQWWRRTKDRRRRAWETFKVTAERTVVLAVSVLGAILISYGVRQVYTPAGYVVGGVMCWLLLWSREKDKEAGRAGTDRQHR